MIPFKKTFDIIAIAPHRPPRISIADKNTSPNAGTGVSGALEIQPDVLTVLIRYNWNKPDGVPTAKTTPLHVPLTWLF